MPQMQVWLPVATTALSQQTGFTNFPDEQVASLIEHYRAVQGEIVCPEPLGKRETFLWDLSADLSKTSGSRPAFADFAALIEAAAYGLLHPRTYDLQQCGFGFIDDHRYLTVLMYSPNAGVPESVVGFFSPSTLVCPAANWTSREELIQHVQRLRDSQLGNGGRALLRAFLNNFPNSQMPWARGIVRILSTHPVGTLDPGEADQSNLGPLLLQAAPGATPQTVFLPIYAPNRLPDLVRRLQGTSYQPVENGVAVMHNGHRLCVVALPASEQPKLFGLGSVEFTVALELPAQSAFTNATKDAFKNSLAPVVNAYHLEVAEPSPRFILPDALRAVFFALGRAAATAFLKGDGLQWLYSDPVITASFKELPHQGALIYGSLQTAPDGIYFADQLPNGRIAVYIQRWLGRDFGELIPVGSALWQVFRARTRRPNPSVSPEQLADTLFRIEAGGRLSTDSPPQPPGLQDALSWSDFLFWLDQQPSPLLRIAASEFAATHGLPDGSPRRRSDDTYLIKIGHHDWRLPK